MLKMFITLRAGINTYINPSRQTALTGGNNLVAVIEHDLLGFRGLVSLFYIVFHHNNLQINRFELFMIQRAKALSNHPFSHGTDCWIGVSWFGSGSMCRYAMHTYPMVSTAVALHRQGVMVRSMICSFPRLMKAQR